MCVLRLAGSEGAIRQFVERNLVEPVAVFDEGVNLDVSSAGLHDFEGQIQDAIAFLEQLYEVCVNLGIEVLCFDFALAQSENFIQNYYLPSRLLYLAGKFEIDIKMSLYPVAEEEEREE